MLLLRVRMPKPLVLIIIIIVVAVTRASDNSDELPDWNAVSDASSISSIWNSLYLSNPEYGERVDAVLSKNQQKLFVKISAGNHQCHYSNLKDGHGTGTCLEALIKNYERQRIDDLVGKLQEVVDEMQLHYDETWKYDHVAKFYSKLVQKGDDGMLVLDRFDESEREFVEDLVRKFNYWFFRRNDLSAFVEYRAFMRNNEMVRKVFKKVEKIEKEL